MRVHAEEMPLHLATPFRIAHRSAALHAEVRHNVLIRIGEGLGEAAAVPYYGERTEAILDWAISLGDLDVNPDSIDGERIERIVGGLPPGTRAGVCAVSTALYDLWGKRTGMPLYQLLGVPTAECPPTSVTVAIDEPAAMVRRIVESEYPIVKVKLGGADDEAVVAELAQTPARETTPRRLPRLRVDANGGWTPERAIRLIGELAKLGVELVEQPLPPDDTRRLRDLRSELAHRGVELAIFADEAAQTDADIDRLGGVFDGVVVKLMKTSGIGGALRMIDRAKRAGLEVMMGCMVESSLGVTAAAHLAPLCTHADLDGPLLITNDRFRGVHYDGAVISLPEAPGIGVAEA